MIQGSRYDALANSAMAEDRPTPETAKLLREERPFQRATQAYLRALPLIDTLGMNQTSSTPRAASISASWPS